MRDLGGDAASAWELELDIGVSGPIAAQGGLPSVGEGASKVLAELLLVNPQLARLGS